VRSCFVLILRLWSTSCLRCLSGRCTVGFAVFGTRGVSTCVTAHFSYTDYRYNYSRTLSCKPLRRVCLCLLTAVENMGGLGASLGFRFSSSSLLRLAMRGVDAGTGLSSERFQERTRHFCFVFRIIQVFRVAQRMICCTSTLHCTNMICLQM